MFPSRASCLAVVVPSPKHPADAGLDQCCKAQDERKVVIVTMSPTMMNSEMRTPSSLRVVGSDAVLKLTAPNATRFRESIFPLFRWKRSIYKRVWKHMLFFVVVYVSLTLLHNFVLDDDGKEIFQGIADYCSRYTGALNLSIMLGFFTSIALRRLFMTQVYLPGTSTSIITFMMGLKPDLPEGPELLAKYARWQVLSWIMAFRVVCKPLRKIYPDLISIQKAGLLEEKERVVLEEEESSGRNNPRSLIVLDWMLALLLDCTRHNRFYHSGDHLKSVRALTDYKKKCGNVIKSCTQNMPYALIQTVILGVYIFGLVTILARNFSSDRDDVTEFMEYFPILSTFQFFVYFAWLSFGLAAVNPFGDDEDDIDVIHLVENHIRDSIRLQKVYHVPLAELFAADLVRRCKFSNEETSNIGSHVNHAFSSSEDCRL